MEKQAKTQQYLPFSAIYDNILILKNGEFRSIILVTALNFELKSQEEQDAIVFAFQGFLNSLSFPIQIVLRSRQIDLTEYIKKLNDRLEQEANELVRYQTQEYILFMTKLISLANIMDKKFFVVLPFRRSTPVQKGWFGGGQTHLQVHYQEFQKIKEELRHREDVVTAGLRALGIAAIKLSTKQIIDLFYESYNITEASREKIRSLEKLGIQTSAEAAISPTQNNSQAQNTAQAQTSQTATAQAPR